MASVTVSDLPNVAHTVAITRVSGNVFIRAVDCHNGPEGIQLMNAAVSGNKASSLVPADFWSISKSVTEGYFPAVRIHSNHNQ